MIFINWFLSIIFAVLLCTMLKHVKKVYVCIICVCILAFNKNIGSILLYGFLIASIFVWLKPCVISGYDLCYNFIEWLLDVKYRRGKGFDELIARIDDTNIDSILHSIHILNNFDKSFLSAEQINIIRQKISVLWRKYIKLNKGKYNNTNRKNINNKNNVRSPYNILGIKFGANKQEIRYAYIKLCKKYHPDVNHVKGAEDMFKEIQEAYTILTT